MENERYSLFIRRRKQDEIPACLSRVSSVYSCIQASEQCVIFLCMQFKEMDLNSGRSTVPDSDLHVCSVEICAGKPNSSSERGWKRPDSLSRTLGFVFAVSFYCGWQENVSERENYFFLSEKNTLGGHEKERLTLCSERSALTQNIAPAPIVTKILEKKTILSGCCVRIQPTDVWFSPKATTCSTQSRLQLLLWRLWKISDLKCDSLVAVTFVCVARKKCRQSVKQCRRCVITASHRPAGHPWGDLIGSERSPSEPRSTPLLTSERLPVADEASSEEFESEWIFEHEIWAERHVI